MEAALAGRSPQLGRAGRAAPPPRPQARLDTVRCSAAAWSLVGEMDGKRETSAHCPGSGTYLCFSSNTVSENEIFVDISTHGGAYYRCTGHRTEIGVTGGEVAELRRNR